MIVPKVTQINNNSEKVCIICDKEFVSNGNHQKTCSLKCREKRKKFKQKIWRENNKEKLRKDKREWYLNHIEEIKQYTSIHQEEVRNSIREIKKWCVDKLGRKCNKCGLVSICDCIYDFHHLNEDKSWYKIAKIKNKYRTSIRLINMRKWQKEDFIPENIILLCSNCHRIISSKESVNN